MNTENKFFTIGVLNLYKGCHMNKTFEDIKSFRAYMKRQAEKGHTNVKASITTLTDPIYHVMWTVVLMPTTC